MEIPLEAREVHLKIIPFKHLAGVQSDMSGIPLQKPLDIFRPGEEPKIVPLQSFQVGAADAGALGYFFQGHPAGFSLPPKVIPDGFFGKLSGSHHSSWSSFFCFPGPGVLWTIGSLFIAQPFPGYNPEAKAESASTPKSPR
jgi:hypothetical protein